MKKGFTLVELLAVLSLVALLGVIIYPKLTSIIEKNREKAFKESVKATIRSYNSYLASENYPDIGEVDITLGIIPTIKESDWKAGVIIQKEDGIYLENLYNGKFCAYGDEDSFTVTKGKCQITPTSCYAFDENTKTITGYKNRSTCRSIVDIPSQINGVNVEHIGREAFYDRGIESLKLPETLLTIEDHAFEQNKLSSIIIPNNVTKIGNTAFATSSLTSVEFPDSLQEIGNYAFKDNYLKTVVLKNNVTKIGDYAFKNNKINTLDLGTSVQHIGVEAFCYNWFSSLTIPSSVTFLGKYAFFGVGLRSLTMPQNTYIEIEGGVFNYNSLPESQAYLYARNTDGTINNTILMGYGGEKKSITIPSTVQVLGNDSIAFNYHLEEIILPEGLKQINYRALYDCDLTQINLPSTLEVIGDYAFENNKITTLNLGTSVQHIGVEAFCYNKIKSLTIPSSVTHLGRYAFFDNELTSLTMPQNTYIEIEGGVFNFNSLPDSQAYLYARNTDGTINNKVLMGYGGDKTSITIPNTVEILGDSSLAYNYHLEEIILPDSLKEIKYMALYDCDLREISLPNSLLSIGGYAIGKNQLSEILIPENVSSIHLDAFLDEDLSKIEINKSENSISGAPWGAENAIVEWLK